MEMKNLIGVFLAFLVIQDAKAQLLTDNIVGEWTFSGNANDTSRSGNNLSVINANLTADRFGNPNSAYNFLGISSRTTGSYLTTSTHNNLPVGQENLTVNLWASVQQPIAGDWRVIFCNGGWDSFQLGLGTDSDDTKRIQYHTGAGLPQISTDQLTWNNAQWYMLTLTVNNGIVNFYRDGVNLATFDVSTYGFGNYATGDSLNLSFGGRPDVYNGTDTLSHPWIGNLDDIRIYNRALSSGEVATVYTTQSVPEPSALSLLAVGLGRLAIMRRRRRS